MKYTLKNIISLASLLSIATTSAMARDKWLDNSMYTVSSSAEVSGPFYSQDKKQEYVSEIFRIIMEEAHDRAQEYLRYGNTEAYWLFMMLAFTVPYHEGTLIHFRQEDNEKNLCKDNANDGTVLDHVQTTKKIFKRYMKTTEQPFIPSCSTLKTEKTLTQMLRGFDGTDIGLMQVNMRWHSRIYLAQNKFKGVRDSIQYGQSLLQTGFERIYSSLSNYTCMKNKNDGLDWSNLIRGTWAGAYNAGYYQNGVYRYGCRFTNPNDPWAGNDNHLKNNLEEILAFPTKKAPFLQMNDEESEVLAELVSNFKNKTNQRTKLDALLRSIKEAKGETLDVPSLDLGDNVQEYKINVSMLNMRRSPKITSTNKCGKLPLNTTVKVVEELENGWLKIRLYEGQIDYLNFDTDRSNLEAYIFNKYADKVEENKEETLSMQVETSATEMSEEEEDINMPGEAEEAATGMTALEAAINQFENESAQDETDMASETEQADTTEIPQEV